MTIPLPSQGEDERVGLFCGFARRAVVEAINVARRTTRQLLHLALSEADSRRAFDRSPRLFVAAPRRLDRAALGEAMRVTSRREVERGVLEVEVLCSLGPVGESGDGHLAEDRLETPSVPGFDGPVLSSLRVAHRTGTHLASRTQVEVVLEELSAQLTAVDVEAGLELVVGESRRIDVSQEADEALVERV